MYSIMNGINVEVYNNGKKVRDNYAVSEDNPGCIWWIYSF